MLFGHYQDKNNAQAEQGASQANKPPDTIGEMTRDPRGPTYEPPGEGDTSNQVDFEAMEEDHFGFIDSANEAGARDGGLTGNDLPPEYWNRLDVQDQSPNSLKIKPLDNYAEVIVNCVPWPNNDDATHCGEKLNCDNLEDKECYYNSYPCSHIVAGGCFIETNRLPLN